MTAPAPVAVDLFAGPGGWSEGLRLIGRADLGIEWEPTACQTRYNAGHATWQADVASLDPRRLPPFDGLIASPPCTAFSLAGKQEGRLYVDALARAIRSGDWGARPVDDPTIWLPLEVGRWAEALAPRWIVAEQVPPALVLWKAYKAWLEEAGYSVWCGVLNAADYGVPQTRRRAFLIARSDGIAASPPEASHSEHGDASLFGTLHRWVSMAEALGWPLDTAVGFPRRDEKDPDAYRDRDFTEADGPAWTLVAAQRRADPTERPGDQPAPTLAFGHASTDWVWRLNTGRNYGEPGDRSSAQSVPVTEPAPTLDSNRQGWQWERPATTIAGDPRLWPPGHKINRSDLERLGPEEAARRYQLRAGDNAYRLTVPEALVLQSFPADYPVAGSRSAQFAQIGNAVPPLVAARILETLL